MVRWSRGDPDLDLVLGRKGGEGLLERPFTTRLGSGDPRTRRGGGDDILGDLERAGLGGGLAGLAAAAGAGLLSLAEGGGEGLLESSLILLDRLRVPMVLLSWGWWCQLPLCLSCQLSFCQLLLLGVFCVL